MSQPPCDLCDVESSSVSCVECGKDSFPHLCASCDESMHGGAKSTKRQHRRIAIGPDAAVRNSAPGGCMPPIGGGGLPMPQTPTHRPSQLGLLSLSRSNSSLAQLAKNTNAPTTNILQTSSSLSAPSNSLMASRTSFVGAGPLSLIGLSSTSGVGNQPVTAPLFRASLMQPSVSPPVSGRRSKPSISVDMSHTYPNAAGGLVSIPLCDVCDDREAKLYCDTCSRDNEIESTHYCTECDSDFHMAKKITFHFRMPIEEMHNNLYPTNLLPTAAGMKSLLDPSNSSPSVNLLSASGRAPSQRMSLFQLSQANRSVPSSPAPQQATVTPFAGLVPSNSSATSTTVTSPPTSNQPKIVISPLKISDDSTLSLGGITEIPIPAGDILQSVQEGRESTEATPIAGRSRRATPLVIKPDETKEQKDEKKKLLDQQRQAIIEQATSSSAPPSSLPPLAPKQTNASTLTSTAPTLTSATSTAIGESKSTAATTDEPAEAITVTAPSSTTSTNSTSTVSVSSTTTDTPKDNVPSTSSIPSQVTVSDSATKSITTPPVATPLSASTPAAIATPPDATSSAIINSTPPPEPSTASASIPATSATTPIIITSSSTNAPSKTLSTSKSSASALDSNAVESQSTLASVSPVSSKSTITSTPKPTETLSSTASSSSLPPKSPLLKSSASVATPSTTKSNSAANPTLARSASSSPKPPAQTIVASTLKPSATTSSTTPSVSNSTKSASKSRLSSSPGTPVIESVVSTLDDLDAQFDDLDDLTDLDDKMDSTKSDTKSDPSTTSDPLQSLPAAVPASSSVALSSSPVTAAPAASSSSSSAVSSAAPTPLLDLSPISTPVSSNRSLHPSTSELDTRLRGLTKVVDSSTMRSRTIADAITKLADQHNTDDPQSSDSNAKDDEAALASNAKEGIQTDIEISPASSATENQTLPIEAPAPVPAPVQASLSVEQFPPTTVTSDPVSSTDAPIPSATGVSLPSIASSSSSSSSSSLSSPPFVGPPCDICDENPSEVRCSLCAMNLCLVGGCDRSLHANAKNSKHERVKLGPKEESVPVSTPTAAPPTKPTASEEVPPSAIEAPTTASVPTSASSSSVSVSEATPSPSILAPTEAPLSTALPAAPIVETKLEEPLVSAAADKIAPHAPAPGAGSALISPTTVSDSAPISSVTPSTVSSATSKPVAAPTHTQHNSLSLQLDALDDLLDDFDMDLDDDFLDDPILNPPTPDPVKAAPPTVETKSVETQKSVQTQPMEVKPIEVKVNDNASLTTPATTTAVAVAAALTAPTTITIESSSISSDDDESVVLTAALREHEDNERKSQASFEIVDETAQLANEERLRHEFMIHAQAKRAADEANILSTAQRTALVQEQRLPIIEREREPTHRVDFIAQAASVKHEVVDEAFRIEEKKEAFVAAPISRSASESIRSDHRHPSLILSTATSQFVDDLPARLPVDPQSRRSSFTSSTDTTIMPTATVEPLEATPTLAMSPPPTSSPIIDRTMEMSLMLEATEIPNEDASEESNTLPPTFAMPPFEPPLAFDPAFIHQPLIMPPFHPQPPPMPMAMSMSMGLPSHLPPPHSSPLPPPHSSTLPPPSSYPMPFHFRPFHSPPPPPLPPPPPPPMSSPLPAWLESERITNATIWAHHQAHTASLEATLAQQKALLDLLVANGSNTNSVNPIKGEHKAPSTMLRLSANKRPPSASFHRLAKPSASSSRTNAWLREPSLQSSGSSSSVETSAAGSLDEDDEDDSSSDSSDGEDDDSSDISSTELDTETELTEDDRRTSVRHQPRRVAQSATVAPSQIRSSPPSSSAPHRRRPASAIVRSSPPSIMLPQSSAPNLFGHSASTDELKERVEAGPSSVAELLAPQPAGKKLTPVESAAAAATSAYFHALAQDAGDIQSPTAEQSAQLLSQSLAARHKRVRPAAAAGVAVIHTHTPSMDSQSSSTTLPTASSTSSQQVLVGTTLTPFRPSRPPSAANTKSSLPSRSNTTLRPAVQPEVFAREFAKQSRMGYLPEAGVLQQQFEMIKEIFEGRQERILGVGPNQSRSLEEKEESTRKDYPTSKPLRSVSPTLRVTEADLLTMSSSDSEDSSRRSAHSRQHRAHRPHTTSRAKKYAEKLAKQTKPVQQTPASKREVRAKEKYSTLMQSPPPPPAMIGNLPPYALYGSPSPSPQASPSSFNVPPRPFPFSSPLSSSSSPSLFSSPPLPSRSLAQSSPPESVHFPTVPGVDPTSQAQAAATAAYYANYYSHLMPSPPPPKSAHPSMPTSPLPFGHLASSPLPTPSPPPAQSPLPYDVYAQYMSAAMRSVPMPTSISPPRLNRYLQHSIPIPISPQPPQRSINFQPMSSPISHASTTNYPGQYIPM